MEPNINTAIKKGYLQQIRFLIEYGHSINERDEDLKTPLINCAFIDNDSWAVGIARLFIEKGAQISLFDKLGLNALHYAALQEKRPLVQLYLNALDYNLNATDKYGNTALHYAASTGNIGVLRDLVNTYSKYGLTVDKVNKKGETALTLAWKVGHFECGDLLVNIGGANEEQRDSVDGLTAREWQKKSLFKMELEESKSARRPKTAVRKIEIKSLRKPSIVSKRPPSAPVLLRRKSSMAPITFGKENKSDTDVIPPVLRQTKSCINYRAAGIDDLRNNPKYVFQLSPVDYFTSQDKYSYPFAPQRSVSAGSKGKHSTANSKIDSVLNSNWRTALKTYMVGYDYQFAHSYRRSAVPPEPEPEENPEEQLESPVPSDTEDHTSQTSKKGKKHDKQEKQEKHDKKKDKHEKEPLKSRKSVLNPPANLDSSSSSAGREGNQSRASFKK